MRGNEVIHSAITYRDTRDIGVDSIVALYAPTAGHPLKSPTCFTRRS
jgi:hypothetical protein